MYRLASRQGLFAASHVQVWSVLSAVKLNLSVLLDWGLSSGFLSAVFVWQIQRANILIFFPTGKSSLFLLPHFSRLDGFRLSYYLNRSHWTNEFLVFSELLSLVEWMAVQLDILLFTHCHDQFLFRFSSKKKNKK